MGHGAATEGPWGLVHLSSDVIHTWAAGIWIGALVVFLALLTSAPHLANQQALYRALHGFSGIGSALVAVLVATGLVNSWFVIGLASIPRLWATAYGQLLTIKVALFLVMVGLAAANRFFLTPQLGAAMDAGSSSEPAVGALRRSLAMETGLSILVLGLVAWGLTGERYSAMKIAGAAIALGGVALAQFTSAPKDPVREAPAPVD